ADYFSSHRTELTLTGDRPRDLNDPVSDVDRSSPVVSWIWSTADNVFVGHAGDGWNSKHCRLSVAVDLSGGDDGDHALFFKLCGRWIARCARSADAAGVIAKT